MQNVYPDAQMHVRGGRCPVETPGGQVAQNMTVMIVRLMSTPRANYDELGRKVWVDESYLPNAPVALQYLVLQCMQSD